MKKFMIFISLLLTLALISMGCGRSSDTSGSTDTTADSAGDVTGDNAADKAAEAAGDETVSAGTEQVNNYSDTSSAGNSGKFACISDIADYWNNLYTANEEVINAYEGMPILELVTPGLCFVSGVQYDLLNISNVDGRFEGNLMLAGYPGFVEKKGSQLTFGYEDVVEEEGFSSDKIGDKKIENGTCDLEKGYYFSDSYTARDGANINRSTSEFAMQADGSMCSLVLEGSTINYSGEDELKTTYIFIRGGDKQYDFVVARSSVGTAYEVLHLEADMTKETAITMFTNAGAAVESSGGMKDGALVLD
ncbi:MAG TPA: hypothetical protein VN258_19480 [Mobilitalea sp.]|nr:hypothetical protein [Mobilitalea sp.]